MTESISYIAIIVILFFSLMPGWCLILALKDEFWGAK